MLLQMIIQLTLRVHQLVAYRTNVRLLVRMNFHMLKHLVDGREALIAQITRRRMIIAMRSQMCRQVVLLIEAFIAEAALEGLFTRVSSLQK